MIDVRTNHTTLFTCLSIETGSRCNRRCAFCPVSTDTRDDEWMPMEMIEKILADLVRLGYKQRLVFHSYNEPTRDERLVDIIRMFRVTLPKVCMMFNTNGDYFKTADDIKKYFYAGLNQMQINVYSAGDGSANHTRIMSGIESAKKRYVFLKELVDSINWIDQTASIYNHIGADGKACEVVPKWDFQPTKSHDNHMPTKKHKASTRHHIANRAGNIPDFMPALDEPLSKMCVRPFREMIINWRGDAVLCCNSYSKSGEESQASVGNVMEKPIEELFNDPRFHIYRVKLQAKDRNIYLCDKCDYSGGFYTHNVPHVTFGAERDEQIITADMRSKEAAGFGELLQIGKKV